MKETDNILGYPQSTIVDKVVPKTMFYKFMEVNQRMKVRFVNDVAQICWLYKLSASTINVTASEELIEIDVFVVTLKAQDCPTDVFTFIDTNMPHHIVFILKYEEQYMLLVNYEAPDGSRKHKRLWNGGNGRGVIKLYKRSHKELELIDEVIATHVGCEYGEYEDTKLSQ